MKVIALIPMEISMSLRYLFSIACAHNNIKFKKIKGNPYNGLK
jgi:hypothetical protein